jgi:hypothetical protein
MEQRMTQNRDFYIDAAAKRVQQLDAERAAAQADLVAHKASGDYDSASEAVQRIANIDAEARNVEDLYHRYVASQTPPQAPPSTDQERLAKPWNRMDASDVLELTRTSKYAKGITWEDPYMRAGYSEAMRRRARGE